jgi:hypothetical protein
MSKSWRTSTHDRRTPLKSLLRNVHWRHQNARLRMTGECGGSS